MNTNRRMTMTVLLLCPFLFGCFCCGGCGVEEQKKDLAGADDLYDRGNRAEAVAKYKSLYESFWTNSTHKQKILPRIVDHEAKAGNVDEAKKWIKRGLKDRLKVEYTDARAKELFAAAEKEHNEQEEKRKADDAAREARANPATAEKYRSIKTGMSYNEVFSVMGVHGEELSRVELAGISTVMVMWSNRNGSNMNVTFENGRVVAKAQFGLR